MSSSEISNAALSSKQKEKRHSFITTVFLRLIREKPLGTFGVAIILVLFLVGIFCNFIAPYSYVDASPMDSLMPPSIHHLLGTDGIGRDEFSRMIYGARVSMIVGLSCASLSLLVAILLGVPSGFSGGKYDLVLQRFIDAWMCLPGILITLVIMTLVGSGLIQVIFVIGLTGGIMSSRVVRSAVIGIKGNTYIEAAKSVGSSTTQTLIRHILPNIGPILIIIFTLQLGGSILMEATISFLGYGIPPPLPSWGGMLSGTGQQYMLQAPWMAIWPGAALAIVIYGVNMFGDGLRDILDPRLVGGLGRYGVSAKKIKIIKE